MARVAATTLAAEHLDRDSHRSLAEQLSTRRKAMSIGDLADILGLSQTTIYDAAREGELPTMRFGGAIRIDPKAAAEWLRKHGG